MSTDYQPAQDYATAVSETARKLLDAVRDSLGARASFRRDDRYTYRDHRVTVWDGPGGRLRVTARLSTGAPPQVLDYTAHLGSGGQFAVPRVGPARVESSTGRAEPEDVSRLLVLLDRAEEGLEAAWGAIADRLRLDAKQPGHSYWTARHLAGAESGPVVSVFELRGGERRCEVARIEAVPETAELSVLGRDRAWLTEVLVEAGLGARLRRPDADGAAS